MSVMNFTKLARAARLAAPLMVGLWFSAPVSAGAAVYMATYQGATFTVTQNSSTDFTFDIAGANALTGDWTGAKDLVDFAFDNIGASGATLTATLINPSTGQTASSAGSGGLNANGCSSSGNFFCFNFKPNVAVASDLKFDITASGGTYNFGSKGPDLKILWTADPRTDSKLGSLYSANIPVSSGVPEPATWAMMLAGFGALGVVMRKRRMMATPATV